MLSFALAAALASVLAAPAVAEPKLAGVAVQPPKLAIRGADDAPQLVVTGTVSAAKVVDLTGSAAYSVSDPKIARVAADGRVYPLANGTAEVTVSAGGHAVKVPLTVTSMEAPLPINFANQIEPVLTKLGCNAGGCHGKIQGQNGSGCRYSGSTRTSTSPPS